MITWIIILIFIVLALFSLKLNHFRHKTFIVLLILLAIFLYATLIIVNSKNPLDFSSAQGFFNSMKVYEGWLANGFQNLKEMAGNAVKMDWTSTNASFLSDSKENSKKTSSSKIKK